MEVEDLINLVCEKLPSEDLEGQCLAFIKEYGPMVVEKLAEEISPSAICAFLKLCTSKSTVCEYSFSFVTLPSVKNSFNCVIHSH